MRRLIIALGLTLPLAAPALAEDFTLSDTWIDYIIHDSIGADGPTGSTLRVPDIGIDGYRFSLEATTLAEIASRLGTEIHRTGTLDEPAAWLCLTTADQAFYVYSADKDEAATGLALDTRGVAPAAAGCARREAPIKLDMAITAPGASLDEVHNQYGLTMPEYTGTFGYGTLSPLETGSERTVWQGIAYHVTDGVVDAYGVTQITGD